MSSGLEMTSKFMFLDRRVTCYVVTIQMVSAIHFAQSTKKLTIKVDICITTPMKALERVCLLAKALADRK